MQKIRFLKIRKMLLFFKQQVILFFIFAAIGFEACTISGTKPNDDNIVPDKIVANVTSVLVTGDPNDYQFSVGVLSPDTGCEQYADWWEVFSEEGTLVYRRILAHSHINEQPFIRSGRPVQISANDVVYVRAHMHPGGYGGVVFKGSVQDGFQEVTVSSDFALGVENEPPQPTDCAF